MSMLAITRDTYCSPGQVELAKIDRPTPGADEVLIKVEAASINPLEVHQITGTPYMVRNGQGLREPKSNRIGVDLAGVVEAVGSEITRFAPGDAVFGGGHGSLAEFCVAKEKNLAHKPDAVSFEDAAAIPVAGVTALHSLRKLGEPTEGDRVLVIGASGGCGTYGVQLAKSMGAHVTGVCSTANVDLVSELGADEVIDYTTADWADCAPFDLIIDNVGNRTPGVFKRALADEGRLVVVSGPKKNKAVGPLIHVVATLLSFLFSKKSAAMVLAQHNADDLALLADHLEAGTVRSAVTDVIGLSDVATALEQIETGHTRGKIVVRP